MLSTQVSPAARWPVMATADIPGSSTAANLNPFSTSMGVSQSVSLTEGFFQRGRVLKCFILNVISALVLYYSYIMPHHTCTLQQRIVMYDSYALTNSCRKVVRRFLTEYPGVPTPHTDTV